MGNRQKSFFCLGISPVKPLSSAGATVLWHGRVTACPGMGPSVQQEQGAGTGPLLPGWLAMAISVWKPGKDFGSLARQKATVQKHRR